MPANPDFVNELKKHFSGDLRLDLASRILYSTDASMYQIEPLGVAIPKTQEDLISAVELAAKYKVPILARGSGSSLAGQAIGEALILDCSRWLNNLVEINHEERTAMVEPGLILSTLNHQAAKHGLQFGPDPASAERATLGGVIANNATGAHSILYGMAADHLISSDVILSDGSLANMGEISIQESKKMKGDSPLSSFILFALDIREKSAEAIKQNYPKSWRNSAGYRLNFLLPFSATKPPRWDGDYPANLKPETINLATLLAGSEGTLAVIRRAKINLVTKPRHTILGVLSYRSIVEACEDVPNLLKHQPSAIELIPQMILRLAKTVPAYAAQMGWVNGDPAAVLVVEFSGNQPQALKDSVLRLRDDVIVAESKEDQARIWNVRKVGLGILDSRPQSARPMAFIEDCAIPVEHLAEFVGEIETILAAHNTEGGIYAHASAGTLHIRPILDLKTGSGVRALRSIAEQTLALTLRLGGSMASEHGDGIARGEWLKQTYGDEVLAAFRGLKRAADPDNLLNPNKMFDAPPMDSHLRYGENYRAQAWTPAIDFSRNGGLVTAIEQCNGQGVCRKDTGVMCPSFQATREEQNSTRGRANLLRALIVQPSPIENHKSETEDAVYNALDLCLACKGCKAECPSGVDMAKLKFAFEAEYYKTHRRPLRDYVFGYFHVAARIFSSFAPLVNFATGISAVKKLSAEMFGITPNRPFPKFSSKRAKPKNHGGQKVIFLSDPYSCYVEPQVEQAAFDILNSLGFDVQVLPIVSAGVALLSKGFLNEARQHAERVLNAIQKVDPDFSMPIIGIEPPEIYSLKNDYLDLLPERFGDVVRSVKNVWLLDEFLVRSDAFRKWRVANIDQDVKNKIKFQPHCHQRAEGSSVDGFPNGVNATLEALKICGYDVELIDAGCCGMAGTFGYEAEHYELSQQVGELKLFPLIRQSAPTTLAGASPKSASKDLIDKYANSGFGGGREGVEFISTGAACRMQIGQGTGVDATHPVMLIAKALNGAEKILEA